jgi:hypothetical protein
MRPLDARCHFALGEPRKQGGKRSMQEHFSAALSLFGEMGMQFWLEKTATALNQPSAQ